MDEMLKTWKEPVPGSMDPRPVFPAEITRPIENALIKAKTSFVQAHQEHLKNQQQQLNRGRATASPAGYRDTPTPPNAYRPTPPNAAPGYGPNYPQQQQQQFPPAPLNGQQYPNQPYGLPPVSTSLSCHSTRTHLFTAAAKSAISYSSSFRTVLMAATISTRLSGG